MAAPPTRGVPFLVMEYIEGTPIDQYCDSQRLTIHERIELFQQVCGAVHYAHQNLIVHRDLKPSNILVTEQGEPKLLDFGIAKLLDPAATHLPTNLTRPEARLLTPEYASPEQVRGEHITTATDVYGLGVLLYQLLTGSTPFRLDSYRQADVERVICDGEPQRPSALVEHADTPAASRRRTTARQLARLLQGDLDNIVLAAMHKEPGRRYSSAEQLAADLMRYRRHEPVLARRDSAAYRFRKFAQRNARGLGTAALVVGTIVGLTSYYTNRLAEQRDIAQERQLTAERTVAFLETVFESSDPNENRGAEIPARALLEEGLARIDDLEESPGVQAALLQTLGRVHQKLGLIEDAVLALRRAVALRRAEVPEGHPALASAIAALAEGLYEAGSYDEAEGLYREALATFERVDGRQAERTAHAMDGLATVLSELGRLDEAEALDREALAIERALHGELHLHVAKSETNLGHMLRRNGKLVESEAALTRALSLKRQLLKEDDLEIAHSLNQLARARSLLGRHEDALILAREGLALRRRILEPPHAEIAASIGNVANILSELGQLAEAETLRREGVAMLKAQFGNTHPYVGAYLNSLARVLALQGKNAQAEAHFREAMTIMDAVLPAAHPSRAYPRLGLGEILLERGEPAAARSLLEEAYTLRQEGLPAGNWLTAVTAVALATSLIDAGEPAAAQPYLEGAITTLTETFGADHPRVQRAEAQLARLAGNR